MSKKHRRKKSLPTAPVTLQIESLSHEGRGVGRIDGKTTFVDGALGGETVEMIYTFQRRQLDEGRVHNIIEASPLRVEPICQHYHVCGGGSL